MGESSSKARPSVCWPIRRTPTRASCSRRFRTRRCRCTERQEMAEPLDDYIDAVGRALGLPIEDDWRPTIRANLEVSLRLAKLVDDYKLPDEKEPASVFTA